MDFYKTRLLVGFLASYDCKLRVFMDMFNEYNVQFVDVNLDNRE